MLCVAEIEKRGKSLKKKTLIFRYYLYAVFHNQMKESIVSHYAQSDVHSWTLVNFDSSYKF